MKKLKTQAKSWKKLKPKFQKNLKNWQLQLSWIGGKLSQKKPVVLSTEPSLLATRLSCFLGQMAPWEDTFYLCLLQDIFDPKLESF